MKELLQLHLCFSGRHIQVCQELKQKTVLCVYGSLLDFLCILNTFQYTQINNALQAKKKKEKEDNIEYAANSLNQIFLPSRKSVFFKCLLCHGTGAQ